MTRPLWLQIAGEVVLLSSGLGAGWLAADCLHSESWLLAASYAVLNLGASFEWIRFALPRLMRGTLFVSVGRSFRLFDSRGALIGKWDRDAGQNYQFNHEEKE